MGLFSFLKKGKTTVVHSNMDVPPIPPTSYRPQAKDSGIGGNPSMRQTVGVQDSLNRNLNPDSMDTIAKDIDMPLVQDSDREFTVPQPEMLPENEVEVARSVQVIREVEISRPVQSQRPVGSPMDLEPLKPQATLPKPMDVDPLGQPPVTRSQPEMLPENEVEVPRPVLEQHPVKPPMDIESLEPPSVTREKPMEMVEKIVEESGVKEQHRRIPIGPQFIKVTRFRAVIGEVGHLRSHMKSANQSLDKIQELESERDKHFDSWHKCFSDLQKKLVYVDSVMFKGEQV